MLRRLSLTLSVSLLLASPAALAAESEPSPWSLHAGGQAGSARAYDGDPELLAGATLLAGYEWLRLGGLAEWGFGAPGASHQTLAGVAGVSPLLGIVRIDALLTIGRHAYENLGNNFDRGSGPEGPSGSSGFIGGRFGAHFELLEGPHVEPGMWLLYENDFAREQLPIEGAPEEPPATLGSERSGVLIGVSIGFDLPR